MLHLNRDVYKDNRSNSREKVIPILYSSRKQKRILPPTHSMKPALPYYPIQRHYKKLQINVHYEHRGKNS